MLGVNETRLQKLLLQLDETHGVVLHPSECTPWIIHPFSLTPTGTYVESQKHGWWAPCLWCALGVATLAGGKVQIHTRLGGEVQSIVIHANDGYPVETEYCVHFAIPPRTAWKNVHAHCAMLLPFRSESEVRDWSVRHGMPYGEVIPIYQTANLDLACR
jgi:hypothetical protein